MPAGNIKITKLDYQPAFQKAYKKLSPELQAAVRVALNGLMSDPMPGKIRFEKLTDYKNPSIFTIHVTGNHSYKISLEIKGHVAILRKIDTHKRIDDNP